MANVQPRPASDKSATIYEFRLPAQRLKEPTRHRRPVDAVAGSAVAYGESLRRRRLSHEKVTPGEYRHAAKLIRNAWRELLACYGVAELCFADRMWLCGMCNTLGITDQFMRERLLALEAKVVDLGKARRARKRAERVTDGGAA